MGFNDSCKDKVSNSKFEIRNKFQCSKNRKFETGPFRFLNFGSSGFGLFRSAGLLSIFGFQVLIRWRPFGVEHKLPAKQYPTVEGLKTILASDAKAKGAKVEDFVDLRFIKELDDSGYIDKLYNR